MRVPEPCEICGDPGVAIWVLQLADGGLIVSRLRCDLAADLPLTFEVAPQDCEWLCLTHLREIVYEEAIAS